MKIPFRSFITAPKTHYLLDADLSQAEAWIVAYKCNDRNMIDALHATDKNYDIHCLTGRVVNNLSLDAPINKDQRYVGKKCNHAFNYRMGPERATQIINKEGLIVMTVKQAKILHKRYHEFYNLRGWWNEIEEKLRSNNRILKTVYGFERTFYGQWGNELFKEATAHEPQSTIQDHMFGAVQKEIGIEGGIKEIYKKIIAPSHGEIRAINTAHDSLVLEVPKSCIIEVGQNVLSLLKRPIMINGEVFTIPADCHYSERWKEGEIEIK